MNGTIANPETKFQIGSKCTINPPEVEIIGVNFKRLNPQSEEITVSYDAVVINPHGGASDFFSDIPESGLVAGHGLTLRPDLRIVEDPKPALDADQDSGSGLPASADQD